ncbi:PTS glucose transporter subunit IIA [Cellulomonas sp. JH27-2]|nr:PTS glucose transporter subunit IIA [Cellulomonas sp. JH27-2]
MAAVQILSPIAGIVRPVADVPDVVFAEQIIGPGIAIEPDRLQTQDVVAPADGVVGALHAHAFALELDDERSVLVHLGIDTVSLAGLGFTLHVRAGDQVRAGQVLMTWSPVDVAAAGLATICPVVALQAPADALTVEVDAGTHVEPGAHLLTWH